MHTTDAPAAANAIADARPSPLCAPVIATTLPSRFPESGTGQ